MVSNRACVFYSNFITLSLSASESICFHPWQSVFYLSHSWAELCKKFIWLTELLSLKFQFYLYLVFLFLSWILMSNPVWFSYFIYLFGFYFTSFDSLFVSSIFIKLSYNPSFEFFIWDLMQCSLIEIHCCPSCFLYIMCSDLCILCWLDFISCIIFVELSAMFKVS